jgi:hypothetical protein
MCEDIRFEQNGLCTLVGVFGDPIHSRVWPVSLPKLCFHVRVRDPEEEVAHTLVVFMEGEEGPLANLDGKMGHGPQSVGVFNYLFAPGPALAKPGRYAARFTLTAENKPVFGAEYAFTLLNPNVDELYVECGKCHVKFASGIVVKTDLSIRDCMSICPRCHAGNLLDNKTAFRMRNPE